MFTLNKFRHSLGGLLGGESERETPTGESERKRELEGGFTLIEENQKE